MALHRYNPSFHLTEPELAVIDEAKRQVEKNIGHALARDDFAKSLLLWAAKRTVVASQLPPSTGFGQLEEPHDTI